MPYIKDYLRADLLEYQNPQTPGELNFCITSICNEYLTQGINYNKINDIVGALECAKLEYYRRIAVPYEIQKCHDNGDVYSG